MRQNPAERIVEFLRLSSECADPLVGLRGLNPGAWRRLRQWLDDAGLAFYFLQKLEDTHATRAIPASVLSGLEQDFETNQRRVAEMSRRFELLNRRFDEAGVRYAVVKGLSLVPQFCAAANLRYQGDFDYLVDRQSLAAARQVLIETGYVAQSSSSSLESIFVLPGTEPSRTNQYGPDAPHAVELHLGIWDGNLHRLKSIPKIFSVERSVRQCLNGIEFPALADEDAFLLQILHACHHIFTDWIRMSCLYEIGYFLNQRLNDTELWNRVEHRVGDSLVLREFVVVVTKLAAKLFDVPLPMVMHSWSAKARPATRLWIDKYSWNWAFCDLPVYQIGLFPTALLARFLRQQYRDDTREREPVVSNSAAHSWPARMASALRKNPSLVLDADWWRRRAVLRRTLFHSMARLRYVCEIPRWRWRNRASVDSPIAGASAERAQHLKPGNFAEF